MLDPDQQCRSYSNNRKLVSCGYAALPEPNNLAVKLSTESNILWFEVFPPVVVTTEDLIK
jgi:hypothetical protein